MAAAEHQDTVPPVGARLQASLGLGWALALASPPHSLPGALLSMLRGVPVHRLIPPAPRRSTSPAASGRRRRSSRPRAPALPRACRTACSTRTAWNGCALSAPACWRAGPSRQARRAQRQRRPARQAARSQCGHLSCCRKAPALRGGPGGRSRRPWMRRWRPWSCTSSSEAAAAVAAAVTAATATVAAPPNCGACPLLPTAVGRQTAVLPHPKLGSSMRSMAALVLMQQQQPSRGRQTRQVRPPSRI